MKVRSINIGGIKIGIDCPPLMIAEMSGNHNQSLERALEIVDAAAAAGAHALKIQTYKPETMTLDIKEGPFLIDEPNSLWRGKTLFSLYREAMTPWEWHEPIKKRCKLHGMLFFSTPFDATAVDFLESLEVDFYKIASFENTDLPLIRKVAATRKPMIISTGLAQVAELEEAVRAARESGCQDLILLKCTSAYPAEPKDANILTIPHMRDLFHVEVGLSDHTRGLGVAVASVALGASVIEKHFTLRRDEGGVDSAFSMEPQEFKVLVEECHKAWESLGQVSYQLSEIEKKSMVFRRSLYITEDLRVGDVFNEENIRAIRPGFGLPTKYLPMFLGRPAKRAIKKGTPLTFDLLG